MAKQLDYHTIREIFTRFQSAEAHPKGELDHVNAYTLVVAVALSAQATDVGVNKATKELFKIADTPQKMLDQFRENQMFFPIAKFPKHQFLRSSILMSK